MQDERGEFYLQAVAEVVENAVHEYCGGNDMEENISSIVDHVMYAEMQIVEGQHEDVFDEGDSYNADSHCGCADSVEIREACCDAVMEELNLDSEDSEYFYDAKEGQIMNKSNVAA